MLLSNCVQVILSDGNHSLSGMCVPQLNTKINTGEISMFSIIKVSQFLVNTLPSGQKMIVVLKCDHVQNFGSIIGNPSDICGSIRVYVRTPTEKTLTLLVEPTLTIADFKTKIQHEEGHPTDRQSLIFKGEELKDDHTLSNYNIWKDSTIQLQLRLMIRVKDEGGEETLITMTRKIRMAKMFSAYASRKKVEVSNLRFTSLRDKNKAIHADDTLESLGYNDNDDDINLLVIHTIMIHVKDERGEETIFKMNPYDKIAKVFSAYASRIEVGVRSLQFFSVRDKDKAIHADDTPQSLVYDDNENDRIDLLVIVHSIMIHVKDEGGEEIHIKMARTSKMAKAFSAYASRKEVDVRSLQFFSVRDEPIGADDTPESLGYNDNENHIKLLVFHLIRIRVKDERGKELVLKMARTGKMEKMFSAYASRKEVDVNSLQFFSVRDKAIDADDTPESLGYNDNDADIKLLVRRRRDTDTNSPTNAGHEHDNR
jgi:hypothetical protein